MSRYGRRSGGLFLAFELEGAGLIASVVKCLNKHGREDESAEIDSSKRFGADEVTLSAREDWPDALVADLATVFTGNKKLRDRALALLDIRRAPQKAVLKNLRLMPAAVAAWLKQDAIDGWVYSVPDDGGASYAYIVTACEYEEADPPNRRASVSATLKANLAELRGKEGKQELYEEVFAF